MSTVKEHYDKVLASVYSWMAGGFDAASERYLNFFRAHDLVSARPGIAIDLGAGSGFQSVPLARLGYRVLAIDNNELLLNELQTHAGQLPVRTILDDLCNFDAHLQDKAQLVVCMTDTIVHLDSIAVVRSVFSKVWNALADNGDFVITFRDLTTELSELDRFIPVCSDDNTILTCFLEYEKETVKVHDLLYIREQDKWQLKKSFYRKLRLTRTQIEQELITAGFSIFCSTTEFGFITIIAQKASPANN